MSFRYLYQWMSLGALLISAGVAFWRGGWSERCSGAAMILAWVATAALHHGLQLWGVQQGVMFVDILLLSVLLFVALRSDRWWPLWACGFQGLNVVLHLAVIADSKVWGLAYFRASSVFSYLVMLALFLGAASRFRPPSPPDAASPLT